VNKKQSFMTLVTMLVLSSLLVFQGCAKKQVKKGKGTIEEGEAQTAEPVEIGYAGGLKRIHFEYDQHSLTADTRDALRENAEWLKKYKNVKAQIAGHCDSRGTQEYNLALGQKRADSVRRYLVDLGVERNRLATISYGEEQPLSPSETEAAWSQNRRAEFVITDK
jgi:peptidoglycan-associated lipoprotein